MSQSATKQCAFPCPYCGSADIRRSRRQGLVEFFKMSIGVFPFRCLACDGRFSGNVWSISAGGYATCPKCLRLDVVPWNKPDARISQWGRLRLAWGAHTYRCNPCRHLFVSSKRLAH